MRNHPIIRTAASGAAALLIDVAVLTVLYTLISLSPGYAAFWGAMCGAVMNFYINKFWAFRDSTPITLRQLFLFSLVAVVSAVVLGATVEILIPYTHYLVAKALGAALVFALWTYPVQAKFVFTHR